MITNKVVINGCVGTGKTTLANLLVNYKSKNSQIEDHYQDYEIKLSNQLIIFKSTNKNYIKNMISGVISTNIAVFMISALFEQDLNKSQTRAQKNNNNQIFTSYQFKMLSIVKCCYWKTYTCKNVILYYQKIISQFIQLNRIIDSYFCSLLTLIHRKVQQIHQQDQEIKYEQMIAHHQKQPSIGPRQIIHMTRQNNRVIQIKNWCWQNESQIFSVYAKVL
ncbi:P-loop_containing nucleoside triphosphate hydrolase [Hexamita inflata]|uniref:P-loop containing nucleoside triphosphate hydrolase n=1 Tax=Hexamita inflata TaxID=28002 RepID=A0AA86P4D3_9EUKA|nr:P-loop containing nucleoside triphosphate hydrolase [Hexamita inflata]